MVVIEPRAADATSYKDETQAFADRIMVLCVEAAGEDLPVSDLLLAQKLVVARAAKESEVQWRSELSGRATLVATRRKCVSVQLYGQWCVSWETVAICGMS